MAFVYVIAALAASTAHYMAFWVPWHSILLFAVLVAPVAWANPKSRWAVGVYIPAVLLVQIFKASFHPDYLWVSFAAYWVAFSALILKLKSSPVIVSLHVFSALSYFAGKMAGAEFSATSTGFPYLLSANIFAIIAILYAGWLGGISIRNMGTHSRTWGLVRYLGWGGGDSYRNHRGALDNEEAQKVGGSDGR